MKSVIETPIVIAGKRCGTLWQFPRHEGSILDMLDKSQDQPSKEEHEMSHAKAIDRTG